MVDESLLSKLPKKYHCLFDELYYERHENFREKNHYNFKLKNGYTFYGFIEKSYTPSVRELLRMLREELIKNER